MARNSEEIQNLVDVVTDGVATQEELGLMMKKLQISISTKIISEMQRQAPFIDGAYSLLTRLYDRLETIVTTDLEIMDINTVLDCIDKITKVVNNYIELQRRIVQGKDLFSQDLFSDKEKSMMKLLNSFKSQEEKRKFLELVEEKFNEDKK